MLFEKVYIEGLAYHLPENIVTSVEIEDRLAPLYDRLKLPQGRLELMSGIRERRFWGKEVLPSEVATLAGEKAIAQSGVDPEQIGCLISASVCRDFLEPSTASVIHNNLKLPGEAFVFDVSNACLGVLNGMSIIASMIEQNQIEAGLVVAGENGGPLVNNTIETLLARKDITRNETKSSFASLTIGSSAVGVVLAHEKIAKQGHRLAGGVSMAETQFNHLCRGNDDSGAGGDWSPLMDTDSETLMQEGCRLAGKTWARTREVLGWSNEEINRVFCHQVGKGHRKLMYEKVGLDPEKDFSTLEFLGNTGSASLPTTLAMGIEKKVLKSGDKAALLGIGSGLNCLMMGVEW
ncbi:MAG: 3-oxoacyl-ACP synthase III [Nitrospina sp.]|jgi:acyl-CoA:acyl-CoA alkyltransferase|nr:3-oxoacyl-ACP synthase III [Nitrospina sp.]MBT3510479.1 3-oxoacyl-ACP synthase III [Nitrospina sp.]MBT3875760.1 3-oxoacyl-ACP synthase III [Nitrospina sp.]MBT4049207.1 3-oxoacyl-ACP synthase III [Nitrospina sp.]MBT4557176.1 3-oxoacyl-ACP synthase III [Nitrospina sp.]